MAWCARHGLPKTARFDLSVYGERDALIFAEAWCDRMQHLFAKRLEVGDALALADWDRDFEESADFIAAVARAEPRQLARAEAIRSLRPC